MKLCWKVKMQRTKASLTLHIHSLLYVLFSAAELWHYRRIDDRTIDLSIMHKIVREMTGTLLVCSLHKQAINLQGNNNDSSQGNKGHPLLPVVINLTHSSIGWKKNASFLTTLESYTGVLQTANLICNHLSFTEERIQFQFFY